MKQEKEFRGPDKEFIIFALLEDKLMLIKKIADSSLALKGALTSWDINQIDGAIALCQEYMNEVDKIDGTIMRFRQHGQVDMQTETGIRMKSLLSSINELLQSVIPLNQACEGAAAQILELHRVEITQLQNTRQAYHGNGGGKSSPARFFDAQT